MEIKIDVISLFRNNREEICFIFGNTIIDLLALPVTEYDKYTYINTIEAVNK